MHGLEVFNGGFLEKSQICLGRLVLNIRDPGECFCEAPRELTAKDIAAPEFDHSIIELLTKQESAFSVKLSKFLRLQAEAKDSQHSMLHSKQVKRYQLLNSRPFFDDTIKAQKTQEWIERWHKEGPIHFAVGLLTTEDAFVVTDTKESTKFSAKSTADINEVLAPGSSTLPVASDALDLEIEVGKEFAAKQNAKFIAPGERIIAVQYIPVKFRGWISKEVDKAFLDRPGVWVKHLGKLDIVRGQNEDVLDASLSDCTSADYLKEFFDFEEARTGDSERDVLIIVYSSISLILTKKLKDDAEDEEEETVGEAENGSK